MPIVCSNCGQRALPTARYCRDCYTVFPQQRSTPAAKAKDSLFWRALPFVMAVGVGLLLYQYDKSRGLKTETESSQSYRGEVKTDSRPSNDSRPNGVDTGAAEGARQPSSGNIGDWILEVDPIALCDGRRHCVVALEFGDATVAHYSVAPGEGTLSKLVPSDDRGEAFLSLHRRATLSMRDADGHSRSTTIGRIGDRRWLALSRRDP